MRYNSTRRSYLKGSITAAALAGLGGCVGGGGDDQNDNSTTGTQQQNQGSAGEISYGGIATVNAGDWSNFTNQSNWGVEFTSIGNSPGDLLSTLIAGGGRQLYDLIAPVGGIQSPLAQEDLIQPVKTDKLDNWDQQYDYWDSEQGRKFISYNDQIYGVPIVWQGDSIAYLPDETGREITSYGALFDDEFKGQTAIEDNYTTAGQKTAMYLKQNDMADIQNPRNMTPDEIEMVVDFLIDQKKQGQFRTMWSGFQTAVNLMANKEVVVMDTWEPVVFSLQDKGINAKYAEPPDEGYLLWAMVDYIINPTDKWSSTKEDAVYNFIDWELSGWYGANISASTGYMTNPAAIDYAKNNEGFDGARIEQLHNDVQSKFEYGGSWQQRWPEHRDAYETQWQRLRNA